MNTFLPYKSFTKSAQVLDDKRLTNQANEAQIIWRTLTGYYDEGKGWPHHPATKMWDGYEEWLDLYYRAIMAEIRRRELHLAKPMALDEWKSNLELQTEYEPPWWLGHPEFHASHRAALLYKDWDYYDSRLHFLEYGYKWFKKCCDAGKPVYFWPTEHEEVAG